MSLVFAGSLHSAEGNYVVSSAQSCSHRRCVQVVSAKGLRAADANGLSDPYAVVHLGDRTQQTRVIQENLNPEWHETFVFSAEEIQSALMDSMSSLLFEVWDSDFGLVADDFLGQVRSST